MIGLITADHPEVTVHQPGAEDRPFDGGANALGQLGRDRLWRCRGLLRKLLELHRVVRDTRQERHGQRHELRTCAHQLQVPRELRARGHACVAHALEKAGGNRLIVAPGRRQLEGDVGPRLQVLEIEDLQNELVKRQEGVLQRLRLRKRAHLRGDLRLDPIKRERTHERMHHRGHRVGIQQPLLQGTQIRNQRVQSARGTCEAQAPRLCSGAALRTRPPVRGQ